MKKIATIKIGLLCIIIPVIIPVIITFVITICGIIYNFHISAESGVVNKSEISKVIHISLITSMIATPIILIGIIFLIFGAFMKKELVKDKMN